MARTHFNTLLACVGLLFITPGVQAESFISADKAFTLDMPAGWHTAAKPQPNNVLAIEKGSSRIDIRTAECSTETCIENKINNDLAEIKRKKMQVVGNSYTGEDIKRIEFSTGEPFFYISFFSAKNDFGAGYFLINGQSYSILARNLTYAETDLIFSFISPVSSKEPLPTATPALEVNLQDPRVYSIAALPQVDEEILLPSLDENTPAPAPETEKVTKAVQPKPAVSHFNRYWTSLKKHLARLRVNTLVAQQMPPYIRHLGHIFDLFILLAVVYLFVMGGALVVRLCKRPQGQPAPANPNSLYPIRFTRLYGTPSLIFRAKDNQGNTLLSLSSRWDSLFMFMGCLLAILTAFLLAGLGFVEQAHLISLSTFTYNTVYSICSLLIPLGLILFFCGVLWSQLVLREVSLFDRKGQKVVLALQKGFGWTHERYEIFFARSQETLFVTRKRFSWRRDWHLFNQEHLLLAHIYETSSWHKILFRKLFGHLWGFLHTDYAISGQMDSTGAICNEHGAFNSFICTLDKPQAVNARDLLVTALLINIRDRDKWYPWFN